MEMANKACAKTEHKDDTSRCLSHLSKSDIENLEGQVIESLCHAERNGESSIEYDQQSAITLFNRAIVFAIACCYQEKLAPKGYGQGTSFENLLKFFECKITQDSDIVYFEENIHKNLLTSAIIASFEESRKKYAKNNNAYSMMLKCVLGIHYARNDYEHRLLSNVLDEELQHNRRPEDTPQYLAYVRRIAIWIIAIVFEYDYEGVEKKLADRVLEHSSANIAAGNKHEEEIEKISEEKLYPQTIGKTSKPFVFEGKDQLLEAIFNESAHILYKLTDDFDEQYQIVQEKQKEIIASAVKEKGVGSVLALSEKIKNPRTVGFVLGLMADDISTSYIVAECLDPDNQNNYEFAKNFIMARCSHGEWEWIENLDRSGWSTDKICNLLIALPFEKKTWGYAKKWLEDDENDYWRRA